MRTTVDFKLSVETVASIIPDSSCILMSERREYFSCLDFVFHSETNGLFSNRILQAF